MSGPAERMNARVARMTLLLAVALVIAGCSSSGGTTKSTPPVNSGSASASASATSTGSSLARPSRSGSDGSPGSPALVHQKLTHFRMTDVTFTGSEAWALGTADCLGGSGTCAAMEHSGDNGRTWQSASIPRSSVNLQGHCTDPCLVHVRFATAKVGYLFGARNFSSDNSEALFMTTDGGRSWQRQSGGAAALETLGGNVIRVIDQGGCPPGCAYRVQTAAVGSSAWRTVTLPGPYPLGDGAQLGRANGVAYLEAYGNPAGGGQTETAVLWTSTDNGTSWRNRGEPCPRVGGQEYDSDTLSVAPDGSASVVCRPRLQQGHQFTVTTTDGGRTFHAGSRTALGAESVTAFGAASSRVLLVGLGDTFRSTDDGRRFARLGANGGSSPGNPHYVGFASSTVGHAISSDRRTLWTTRDSGATWTAHKFT
ncbi:MAG: hypothetical protein ACR2LX_14550 [Jatrophihabitans sp.]